MFDFLKTAPQYVIPKQSITSLAGCLADVKNVRIKNYLIQKFITAYQVNMKEALIEDPTAYSCFNEFFIRHLKPECRPIAQADIISPVDGCVSEIGAIKKGQIIQAKGRNYSVAELLDCDEERAQTYLNGRFATLYLSPKDYHRVHMPIDATLTSMTYIPGALFSVQPTTARVVPKLFARNERLAIHFTTKTGPMVMVMVGATIVGSIGTTWCGDLNRSRQGKIFDYTQDSPTQTLVQGSEMGYFKLGSTVVLLFANSDHVEWNHNLSAGTSVRFGQAMGVITKAS